MSNWGIEDATNDLGNSNEMTGPKALRDAYEAMKQQNKDLADGLAAVQRQLSQQKVSATLSELGVPTAAAALYTGDADPEKVKEWASTMRSVFGGQGTPSAPTADPTTPVLDGETARQLQSFNEAGAAGTPLSNADAALGRINDATDIQGLLKAWQTM